MWGFQKENIVPLRYYTLMSVIWIHTLLSEGKT